MPIVNPSGNLYPAMIKLILKVTMTYCDVSGRIRVCRTYPRDGCRLRCSCSSRRAFATGIGIRRRGRLERMQVRLSYYSPSPSEACVHGA